MYITSLMYASINKQSIADTEAHVVDICTWKLGGEGNLYFICVQIINLL